MSDRIWLWFADNGNIRKWQREPFPEGTEYVVAAQADAELEEMTRSCLAERAGAASLRSKLEEAEGARGSALVVTPPAVTTPGQFAERVVAACRGYMNTYDVLAKEIRENMQISMAEALRAADAVTNPATPPAEPVVEAPQPANSVRKAAERVVWFDWSSNDPDAVAAVDALRAALAATPAVKDNETVVLPRLTDDIIRAACTAHFGTDNADGVCVTVRDRDWTFREAFKRMWSGARSALAAKDGRS